ncbi:MAG: hypothetical protein AB1489_23525 [Acidobacteriota bacterium]
MKIEQYTDYELIALLTASQQSPEQVQAVWREFISRFEYMVFITVRISFRGLALNFKPTIAQVGEIVEEIFARLSEDNFKLIQESGCQPGANIEIVLQKMAFEVVLEYLNKVGDRKPV